MLDFTNLIQYTKKSLRIEEDEDEFDTEIETLLKSSVIDLKRFCKVRVLDLEDDYIKTILVLYVKANFGLENKDAEKSLKLYEKLRRDLSNSLYYTDTELKEGQHV